MAQRRFADGSAIERVEYLTSTNGHHEYREKPLPVYAVTFRQPAHATVYVAAPLGTMQMIRTDPWRFSTCSGCCTRWTTKAATPGMPDRINNSILRAFSALGLLTISSGFARVGGPTVFYPVARLSAEVNTGP